MSNFTMTTPAQNGTIYYSYEADRKRGGASWVFFDAVPYDTTYSPTWPNDISGHATFEGIHFISRCMGDVIKVCFDRELSISELDDLDFLYDNHVAPVPV